MSETIAEQARIDAVHHIEFIAGALSGSMDETPDEDEVLFLHRAASELREALSLLPEDREAWERHERSTRGDDDDATAKLEDGLPLNVSVLLYQIGKICKETIGSIAEEEDIIAAMKLAAEIRGELRGRPNFQNAFKIERERTRKLMENHDGDDD